MAFNFFFGRSGGATAAPARPEQDPERDMEQDEEEEVEQEAWPSAAPDHRARFRSSSPEYPRSHRSERPNPYEYGLDRRSASPRSPRSNNNADASPRTIREQTPVGEDSSLREAHEDALRQLEALSRALSESQMQGKRQAREYRNKLAIAQASAEELSKTLCETEARLAVATNDLSNLRSLTGADKADPQALITLFDDMNDAIAEFAFRLVDDLPFGQNVVTARNVRHVQKYAPREYDLLGPFMDYAVGTACQVADVLIYACQTIFAGTLHACIFARFAAFQKREQSHYLHELEGWVQREASQEQSARWRAVTYRAAQAMTREADVAGALAHRALDALRGVLLCLADSRDFDADAQLGRLGDDARKIAGAAARLHAAARGAHLLYDYAVFLPAPGARLADAEMEREDPPEGGAEREGPPEGGAEGAGAPAALDPGCVLLAVSLGLRATRTEAAADPAKGSVRTTRILKKAHVITGSISG